MIFKKIRKGHVDWRNFLCGTPANDYIFKRIHMNIGLTGR